MDIENITVQWYQDEVMELNCNICDQYINVEEILSSVSLIQLVSIAEDHICKSTIDLLKG